MQWQNCSHRGNTPDVNQFHPLPDYSYKSTFTDRIVHPRRIEFIWIILCSLLNCPYNFISTGSSWTSSVNATFPQAYFGHFTSSTSLTGMGLSTSWWIRDWTIVPNTKGNQVWRWILLVQCLLTFIHFRRSLPTVWPIWVVCQKAMNWWGLATFHCVDSPTMRSSK